MLGIGSNAMMPLLASQEGALKPFRSHCNRDHTIHAECISFIMLCLISAM
jgi:hypothetical protein